MSFFEKNIILCPECSKVNMIVCKNPKGNGCYLRTRKGQKNEHDKNCKYRSISKEKNLKSINRAIKNNSASDIYKTLINFKELHPVNVEDLTKDAELKRDFFHGNISDIGFIGDTAYINFCIKNNNENINPNQFYVDLMFGKSFFENTQIDINEFRYMFDILKTKDIRTCTCYGCLVEKKNHSGFNIRISNILDFLIDGKEIYKYLR